MRAWLILTRLTVEEEEEIERSRRRSTRSGADVSLAEMFGPVLHPAVHSATAPAPGRAAGGPAGISRGARRRGVAAHAADRPRRGDRADLGAAPGRQLLAVVRRAVVAARRRRGSPSCGSPRPRARGTRRPPGPRTAAFDDGLGVDGVYQLAGRPPGTALARLVVVLDRDVIDAYVRGTAVATRWAGRRRARHTRRPSPGLVWVLCGVLAVGARGGEPVVAALLAALLLPAAAAPPGRLRPGAAAPAATGWSTATPSPSRRHRRPVVATVVRPTGPGPAVDALARVRWHFAVDGISAPLLLLTAAPRGRGRAARAPTPPGVGSGATLPRLPAAGRVRGPRHVPHPRRRPVLRRVRGRPRADVGADQPVRRRATTRRPGDAAGRFVLYTVLGSTLMLWASSPSSPPPAPPTCRRSPPAAAPG